MRWEFYSGHLNDRSECLVLKLHGVTYLEFMPNQEGAKWHMYMNQFPLLELADRDACINKARKITQVIDLEPIPFPYIGGLK